MVQGYFADVRLRLIYCRFALMYHVRWGAVGAPGVKMYVRVALIPPDGAASIVPVIGCGRRCAAMSPLKLP